MTTPDPWYQSKRIGGLRRFALAITALNILGHTVLGFEQSWAQPLVALATAYSVEILLEWIDARLNKRRAAFSGGIRSLIDFLLAAHITGLAVSMLLYANERLWPIAFATAAAIGSKAIFRVPTGRGSRHFFNPSNFGITLTLLLFSWIGIAPPYQFTENTSGLVDWILPGFIVVSGTFINARFTGKMPLIIAWLVTFASQAVVRSVVFGTPVAAGLMPMTGLAFVLYTFYMVTDPGTTPVASRDQIVFGAGVAAVYGLLMALHIVFGFFFALTIVCAVRGMHMYTRALAAQFMRAKVVAPAGAALRRPEV